MKPSLRRAVAAATTLALGVVGLAVAALTTAPPAQAASLVSVPSFGSNPGGLGMSLFVPDSLPARPAVLVVVHYCTGSRAGDVQRLPVRRAGHPVRLHRHLPAGQPARQLLRRQLVAQAAHATAARSDPASIVSMVRYVQQRYTTDTSRVFVTGVSSGAMTTEVLLATYPDVFAAGLGVRRRPGHLLLDRRRRRRAPPRRPPWNSDCSRGRLVRTAQQWGDLARAAYPGYTGPARACSCGTARRTRP